MLVKRIFDIIISLVLFIVFFPIILFFSILIFFSDFNNPLYISNRVGKNGKIFKIVKLRTMKIHNNNLSFSSTADNDFRITALGRIIRKFKLDELTQVINIFFNDMSFVGPRPNVLKDVNVYTKKEKMLLTIKPGITDLASIIFSDEGKILFGKKNPDIAYNQLIRPWKSRLALFYIYNRNFFLDIYIIIITFLSIINKKLAFRGVYLLLKFYKAPKNLLDVSLNKKLLPYPPPGSKKIFKNY